MTWLSKWNASYKEEVRAKLYIRQGSSSLRDSYLVFSYDAEWITCMNWHIGRAFRFLRPDGEGSWQPCFRPSFQSYALRDVDLWHQSRSQRGNLRLQPLSFPSHQATCYITVLFSLMSSIFTEYIQYCLPCKAVFFRAKTQQVLGSV